MRDWFTDFAQHNPKNGVPGVQVFQEDGDIDGVRVCGKEAVEHLPKNTCSKVFQTGDTSPDRCHGTLGGTPGTHPLWGGVPEPTAYRHSIHAGLESMEHPEHPEHAKMNDTDMTADEQTDIFICLFQNISTGGAYGRIWPNVRRYTSGQLRSDQVEALDEAFATWGRTSGEIPEEIPRHPHQCRQCSITRACPSPETRRQYGLELRHECQNFRAKVGGE